ncbi:E3 ubiquitin-protein ligase TRIM52-like [Bos indicus]|uniref:E3 ubiquitin-protein ligase TRIM52-like n=1 Tax=Bos indicus TaxID=9915 RepID=A0ABM4T9D8_BOSIN
MDICCMPLGTQTGALRHAEGWDGKADGMEWGKEDNEQDREEEDDEWEEDEEDEEAVGAIGGWGNSIREVLYQGNADEELFQDQEDDEPWVGDGGIRDSMDYVWDQEEDTNYYLGGLRHDLRIKVNLQEEEILEEYDEDDEELYPGTHLAPPPAPPRQFICPQCRKSFKRCSFRPNLQLANMVQIIHQMCPTPINNILKLCLILV